MFVVKMNMSHYQRNLSATFAVDKEKQATHAVITTAHITDNMGFSMKPRSTLLCKE